MDWRGIEWVVPLYETAALVVPVYTFFRLSRRVELGGLKKHAALGRFAALTLAPVIGYCLFFVALLATEAAFAVSVITEGLARSFLLLVGLGIAVWLLAIVVFAARLPFLRVHS